MARALCVDERSPDGLLEGLRRRETCRLAIEVESLRLADLADDAVYNRLSADAARGLLHVCSISLSGPRDSEAANIPVERAVDIAGKAVLAGSWLVATTDQDRWDGPEGHLAAAVVGRGGAMATFWGNEAGSGIYERTAIASSLQLVSSVRTQDMPDGSHRSRCEMYDAVAHAIEAAAEASTFQPAPWMAMVGVAAATRPAAHDGDAMWAALRNLWSIGHTGIGYPPGVTTHLSAAPIGPPTSTVVWRHAAVQDTAPAPQQTLPQWRQTRPRTSQLHVGQPPPPGQRDGKQPRLDRPCAPQQRPAAAVATAAALTATAAAATAARAAVAAPAPAPTRWRCDRCQMHNELDRQTRCGDCYASRSEQEQGRQKRQGQQNEQEQRERQLQNDQQQQKQKRQREQEQQEQQQQQQLHQLQQEQQEQRRQQQQQLQRLQRQQEQQQEQLQLQREQERRQLQEQRQQQQERRRQQERRLQQQEEHERRGRLLQQEPEQRRRSRQHPSFQAHVPPPLPPPERSSPSPTREPVGGADLVGQRVVVYTEVGPGSYSALRGRLVHYDYRPNLYTIVFRGLDRHLEPLVTRLLPWPDCIVGWQRYPDAIQWSLDPED